LQIPNGATNNIQDRAEKGPKHYILHENGRPHIGIRENNQKKLKQNGHRKLIQFNEDIYDECRIYNNYEDDSMDSQENRIKINKEKHVRFAKVVNCKLLHEEDNYFSCNESMEH